MKNLGTVSEDELERVLCATKMINLPENAGYGITLSVVEGKRAWVIASQQIEVMIVGDKASFDDTYVIPVRLISNGNIQAHFGNDTVELTVDGDKARFTGEQGFSEMQLLNQVQRFSDFDTTNTSVAQMRGYHLAHLIELGTSLPTGIDHQDVFNRVPTISGIRFCKDSIEITSEFAEVNAPSSHTNVKATVRGKTGQILVLRNVLGLLGHLVNYDKVGQVKVSSDIENGTNVMFEADNWKATILQQQSAAGFLFNLITNIFEKENVEYAIGDDSRICAKFEGRNVEMQILDGRLQIIRCTTEVISGVEPTWALLREIDQQNESRACTKFFMRGDAVVACVDLVCNQSLDILTELHELIEDTRMLDVCLSALGSPGTQFELFK